MWDALNISFWEGLGHKLPTACHTFLLTFSRQPKKPPLKSNLCFKESHKLRASLFRSSILLPSQHNLNNFYMCNSWLINCYVISAARRTNGWKTLSEERKVEQKLETDEACDTFIAMLNAMRSLTHVRYGCEFVELNMFTQLKRLRRRCEETLRECFRRRNQ